MNPLAGLLHEKQEDRFVVALKELMQDRVFATQFLQLATHDTSFVRKGRLWKAESHAAVAGGIADLLITGENACVILEAKIGAPFGKDQPQNYALYLSELADRQRTIGKIVILAPASSLTHYSSVAKSRLNKAGVRNVGLSVLSWEQAAELCEDLASELEPATRAYVSAYAEAIRLVIGSRPRPLTDREAFAMISPETTNGLRYAVSLVEPLVDAIRKTLRPNAITTSNGAFFNGKNLFYKKRRYWIGVWIDMWIEHGSGPLWFQTIDRKVRLSLAQMEYLKPAEYGSSWLFPLALAAKVSDEEQIQTIMETIRTVARIEAGAG